jgi:hypothetical protein
VTTDSCFERVVSILIFLYGPWFVFIMECAFDNTDMEGTTTDWYNVSGVHTHRSVKMCLNLLNHQF